MYTKISKSDDILDENGDSGWTKMTFRTWYLLCP